MKTVKKKICFLQYDLTGGGAERKVCTLADYFVSQGYEVEIGLYGRNVIKYELDPKVKLTYICRNTYQYKNALEKFKYNLRCLLQNVFIYVPAVILENTIGILLPVVSKKVNGQRVKNHFWKKNNYIEPIQSFILQHQDCVLITMMVQCYVEIMELMKSDIKKGRFKAPYIVMECSNPGIGMDVSAELAKKRDKLYPMASKCITMTQGAVDCFNDDIKRKSIIIPNPVRSDLPQPYDGVRRHTVVNYCRLHKSKNLPLLIEAFAEFAKEYPDYTLEIYGTGEQKEKLKQRIDELGISDSASIFEFDPNIHERIRDCMMYVSSSDWEGFSNSILEALAIGIPVISTDCDFGPRDMIVDHMNGILVPVGNKEQMCKAMKEIAENSELAERLSRNAVGAREKFSVQKIGDQWLKLIDEEAKERI